MEAQRQAIDAAVAEAFSEAVAFLDDNALAAPFVEMARAATVGGKRFRGLGALLGFKIIDEDDRPAPLAIAAALELYQASALVHDDVIDRADTRRGRVTPHVAFEALHRDSSWIGDPAHFGTSAAILAGDLLLSAADCALYAASPRVKARFAQMTAEVAVGQYLDVRAENIPIAESGIDLGNVLEVVKLKSARYSVMHPVTIGAIAAGAPDEVVLNLERILEPWGIAFQLRDDELGVFGDSAATGKPVGDDIREGKRTALLALTWANSDPAERAIIAAGLGREDADIAEMQMIAARRGRVPHEKLISEYIAAGDDSMSHANLSEEEEQELREFRRRLTERAH